MKKRVSIIVHQTQDAEEKRRVRIELKGKTYFVLYQDRKKYGHYSIAQFYAPDKTLAQVEAWVKAQSNLILDPSTTDAKWTGSYTALVKGKSVSISGTVEAPDGYAAGDRLRELFEKKYGTNYSYPVARFKGGSKRLEGSASSRSIAMAAGPEEDE